ncbi:hypothetical protein FYK20_20755 [Escherichia albertii]|nr:hypothetical protein FYK20_20755 [Escherichia albertii]
MTSLKTSIKTITYLSDTGCLEIQGASLDYSNVMAFYHPFKVGFYKRYSSGGIPDGAVNTLLPVTLTLDVITSPLQLIVASAMSK